MKKYIYSEKGNRLLRVEERTPIHEEDFCEYCAGCLHCIGHTVCYIDEYNEEIDHEWVEYEVDRSDDRSIRNERRKEKSWN